MVYLAIVGLLIYARHYLWHILKQIPASLYISVAVLALLQYMGENAIIISETIGVVVEEITEMVIYSIALLYLVNFKLDNSENSSAAAESRITTS